MCALFLLLSLINVVVGCYGAEEYPFVETPLGAARGYYKTSHGGKQFAAFEGLPYAKPPVGYRRFEEPDPIDPWLGIWTATFSTYCIQAYMQQPTNFSGNEDCLYINVYVPKESPNPEDKLDVIVHIHGGAFVVGNSGFAQPDFLMDKNVILVTFNYRLGIFGFLSTEDDIVPGNNGLKDQTMALNWVQQNIASFGGNPNSVTITGGSAGGASVHFHYLSDLSKGLFHRGFSESGVSLNPWALQEQPLERAQKLAAGVGCPTSQTKEMVDCLKQRPYQQLMNQWPQFFEYLFLPCVPFGPVVEKGGNKPFLKEDPYLLLKKGEVTDVPWIASLTTHEGLFPILFFMNDLDAIDEKWNQLAAFLLDYNNTAPEASWESIGQKIKQEYLNSGKISQENLPKVVKMFSDRYFVTGVETAVRMQANVTKSPVYFYVFAYLGDGNPLKMAGHVEDFKYFFTNSFTKMPLTQNELKMSATLTDMLVQFAKTGKANIQGLDWQPTKGEQLTYLKINGIEDGEITLEMTEDISPKKFWNDLRLAEGGNLLA